MTVTDPRSWNPSGPHIGPDEDDLAFLTTTGDSETDLGSVVLAVHRVGAAACEAVMRAPLPDEFRMIEALAHARSTFAPPAVEAVSKAVSSASYADLLLRDIFDDAEKGALAVYTACVSKAVAPPLAVQRAGLVYGVPREDLGRYIKVAANPQVHPVALADAADRMVLAWAAGVAKAEATEVVSKRSVAEWNTTAEGQEHPKGQRGRFVATLERPSPVAVPGAAPTVAEPGLLARLRSSGFGGQTAPEVAPAPPVTVAEPAPVQTERVTRTKRVKRTKRTKRGSTIDPLTGQRLVQTLKPQLTMDMKQAALGQRLEQALQHSREQEPDEAFTGDLTHELTRTVNTGGEMFTRLPKDLELTFVVPARDAHTVWNAAPGEGTAMDHKWLRIGGLQRLPGWQDPERWGSEEHTDLMANVADDERPPDDVAAAPASIEISSAELDRHGIPDDAKAILEWAKRTKLTDQLLVDEEGRSNPLRIRDIGVHRSADRDGKWYLVRRPERTLYGDDDPPMPHIAEVTVYDPRGELRGSTDYQRKHPYYTLDPNQAMQMRAPVTLWSQKHKAFVDRYHLRPMGDSELDEWYGKAITTQERSRMVLAEPRDVRGRWAEQPSGSLLAQLRGVDRAPEVVKPVVTPIARTKRTKRGKREKRGALVPVTTSSLSTPQLAQRLEMHISPKMAQALRHGLERSLPVEPVNESSPVLDDQARHKLLSWNEWGKFLYERAGYNGFADDVVTPLPLNGSARNALAETPMMTGEEVDAQLRLNIQNEITQEHQGQMSEVRELRRKIGPNDQRGWETLGDDIASLLAARPELSHVQVRAGRELNDVRVFVNDRPVHDQVLIYWPEDYDPDSPVTLRYLGKARQNDLTRRIWRHNDPANVIDAPVTIYRAEQRIYRADQS